MQVQIMQDLIKFLILTDTLKYKIEIKYQRALIDGRNRRDLKENK